MPLLDPSLALAVLVLLVMAVVTAAIGVYLLRTNPPKDDSKFLGVGAEKLTDEEVAARERRRRERDRDDGEDS